MTESVPESELGGHQYFILLVLLLSSNAGSASLKATSALAITPGGPMMIRSSWTPTMSPCPAQAALTARVTSRNARSKSSEESGAPCLTPVWVYVKACRALAVTPTCTVYTSASPSSAFFVVALQAQGLYDAVTHLRPCEVPRSMLSLRYCALSHSARSHRAPLHHSIARPRHTPTRTTQLVAAYPRT